jgi:hypothetical protein
MPETPREIVEAWTDSDQNAQGLLDDLAKQGYVIVPIKPTEEMCRAFYGVINQSKIGWCEAKWKAMLDAIAYQ